MSVFVLWKVAASSHQLYPGGKYQAGQNTWLPFSKEALIQVIFFQGCIHTKHGASFLQGLWKLFHGISFGNNFFIFILFLEKHSTTTWHCLDLLIEAVVGRRHPHHEIQQLLLQVVQHALMCSFRFTLAPVHLFSARPFILAGTHSPPPINHMTLNSNGIVYILIYMPKKLYPEGRGKIKHAPPLSASRPDQTSLNEPKLIACSMLTSWAPISGKA